MARSHVLLGASAWIAAAPFAGLPALDPVLLGLAVAGALLPDVDHPRSWVGRRARPLSAVLAGALGHRGVTHSLLAVGVCAWGASAKGAPGWTVEPLAVGYLSHLAADMLTPAGLRLLWPLRGTWALPICRTGSFAESVVVGCLMCAAAYGLVRGNIPETRGLWRRVLHF